MVTVGLIHTIAAGTALIYQLMIFRLGGFDYIEEKKKSIIVPLSYCCAVLNCQVQKLWM